MIDKLRPALPVLILVAFVFASAAIWIPRSNQSPFAAAPALTEVEERLTSGSERLAGLIEATNARPVFHASRRAVMAPEAPKTPEPVLSLLGIIAEEKSETLAFVKVSTSGSLYRIAKGETIGRWRILDIGTEEIRVSKDGNAPYTLKIGD